MRDVLFLGYSTVKTKDRGFLETVPQLAIKGVGYVCLIYSSSPSTEGKEISDVFSFFFFKLISDLSSIPRAPLILRAAIYTLYSAFQREPSIIQI